MSPVYLQLKADLLEAREALLRANDPGLLGCAQAVLLLQAMANVDGLITLLNRMEGQ